MKEEIKEIIECIGKPNGYTLDFAVEQIIAIKTNPEIKTSEEKYYPNPRGGRSLRPKLLMVLLFITVTLFIIMVLQ